MHRRTFLTQASVLGAAFAVGDIVPAEAYAQTGSAPGARDADRYARTLAIVNAKVITLDTRQPSAEAVLVRNGRIALVGSTQDVKARAAGARVLDLGGRALVPGFIDAHTHFELACNAAAYQVMCQVPPASSLADMFDRLRAKAAATPPGRWIVGRGPFGLANLVPEKRLATRADLDAISQTQPIVLLSGLHVAMMNTPALKAIGLWEPGAETRLTWPGGTPTRGTVVHREPNGVPLGIATELQFLLVPAWNYSVEETQAAIRTHARELFHAKGITSVATLPFFVNELRASQQLQARGELPLRLRVYYRVPLQLSIEGFFGVGWSSGMGDDMFRYGGLKMYVDGNGDDGLGHEMEDYKWTQAELTDMVTRAQQGGIQSIMHVVTRGGLQVAMTAVEAAQRNATRSLRHRVEHVGFLNDPKDIARLQQLGMRLTITRATPPVGDGRGRRGPAFAALIRAGLDPIAVSDATGTTPGFSPMAGIASLVDWAKGTDAVSFDDALRMWTLWAARGELEDEDKGSIEVGKLGDFAVLSADPRGRTAGDLADVRVDATILGGDVVFER